MPAFVVTLPVRFADIDHAGIVYYPRYFNFFHLAFEEFWRARLGARAYVRLLDEDRVGFPTVRAECEFKGPLRFGDDAEVHMAVTRLGTTSITFAYTIFRAAEAARPAALVARGTVVTAVVDLEKFVPIAPSAEIRALLAGLLVDDNAPA